MKVPEVIPRVTLPSHLPAEIRDTFSEFQRSLENTNSVLIQLCRAFNRRVEFGNPTDGAENVYGNWVEGTFTGTDAAVTFTHNLGVTPAGATPNVRWDVKLVRHDGQAAVGASTISLMYVDGDTITANAIQLRLYAEGTRTIDGDHPVNVSLFFYPAVS